MWETLNKTLAVCWRTDCLTLHLHPSREIKIQNSLIRTLQPRQTLLDTAETHGQLSEIGTDGVALPAYWCCRGWISHLRVAWAYQNLSQWFNYRKNVTRKHKPLSTHQSWNLWSTVRSRFGMNLQWLVGPRSVPLDNVNVIMLGTNTSTNRAAVYQDADLQPVQCRLSWLPEGQPSRCCFLCCQSY